MEDALELEKGLKPRGDKTFFILMKARIESNTKFTLK